MPESGERFVRRNPVDLQVPKAVHKATKFSTVSKFIDSTLKYFEVLLFEEKKVQTTCTVRLGKTNTGTLCGVLFQKKVAGPQKRAT